MEKAEAAVCQQQQLVNYHNSAPRRGIGSYLHHDVALSQHERILEQLQENVKYHAESIKKGGSIDLKKIQASHKFSEEAIKHADDAKTLSKAIDSSGKEFTSHAKRCRGKPDEACKKALSDYHSATEAAENHALSLKLVKLDHSK